VFDAGEHQPGRSREGENEGRESARLQQGGFVPVLIKVVNESTSKKPLAISSPQSGLVFGGGGAKEKVGDKKRFLQSGDVSGRPHDCQFEWSDGGICDRPAYYSSEPGSREATIAFDIGQGTQDLGFSRRSAYSVRRSSPRFPVKLAIHDFDGKPTIARLTITDKAGRVYPPQSQAPGGRTCSSSSKSIAPMAARCFSPPGEFKIAYGRGPEYKLLEKQIAIPDPRRTPSPRSEARAVGQTRWIMASTTRGTITFTRAGLRALQRTPPKGVFAQDHVFCTLKGEGTECRLPTLTWGPCYEFQRQFFETGRETN